MTKNQMDYFTNKVLKNIFIQFLLIIVSVVLIYGTWLFFSVLSMGGFEWAYKVLEYVILFSYDFYDNMGRQDPLTYSLITSTITIYIIFNLILFLRKKHK